MSTSGYIALHVSALVTLLLRVLMKRLSLYLKVKLKKEVFSLV